MSLRASMPEVVTGGVGLAEHRKEEIPLFAVHQVRANLRAPPDPDGEPFLQAIELARAPESGFVAQQRRMAAEAAFDLGEQPARPRFARCERRARPPCNDLGPAE